MFQISNSAILTSHSESNILTNYDRMKLQDNSIIERGPYDNSK